MKMYNYIAIPLSDWVFDIRDMYENCDLEPDNCEAQGFKKIHSFDKSVDATNVLNVTCEEGYRADTLPDWVWRLDGFEFTKYMPSCYDPTYCEEDPPHVSNAIYKPPEKGTMKYKDGEQITYICENPGIIIANCYNQKNIGSNRCNFQYLFFLNLLRKMEVDTKINGKATLMLYVVGVRNFNEPHQKIIQKQKNGPTNHLYLSV